MFQELKSILGQGGRFGSRCPGYEYRQEQVEMAQAVGDALAHGEHLFVEAGTGVGKTVAYLTPTILFAAKDKRVIVSTHTINLQGQLVEKDIPMMRSVMEEYPFDAVQMKGRGNFLCLKEMDYADGSIIYAGDSLYQRVKNWAANTQTGDVGELDFIFPDWHELCSNQDTCRGRDCPYHEERCFYYKMRRKANSADIVIVNHSLFFSDLGIRMLDPRNSILPDYGAVIFDEAHHLEDVAANTFGIEFSNYRVRSVMNRLRKRRELDIAPGEFEYIEGLNNALFEVFTRVRKQEFFFDELYASEDKSEVEELVNKLAVSLDSLNTQLLDVETDGDQEMKERIDGYRRMVGRTRGELTDLFFNQEPNYFRWGEKVGSSKFVNCCLHFSPVSVAELLQGPLWNAVESAICTSATLSNSGKFNYMKKRLGVEKSAELILGSPFDYKTQALLYVPEDLDLPSDKNEYADSVADKIEELLKASEGKAFLLFTSYRMLNAVFDRLVDRVPYRLLKQGEMSNDRLIKEFRIDPSTCLMGVHSFWEGVDVKGERLSLVVIDKLPFAVPDTPTNKARCEQIESEGGNWFMEYAVPQAQIRLKQGFGRLVRTKNDRGVVAILDVRIHKKFYGREFLRYLPHCKGTKRLEKAQDFLRECRDLSEYAVSDNTQGDH